MRHIASLTKVPQLAGTAAVDSTLLLFVRFIENVLGVLAIFQIAKEGGTNPAA
ncbi:MAG: hypothetical protein AAB353_06640 [Candidatus Hydrogenedentota bacterium]